MVDLQSRKGYLKIDDETGHIVVSAEYLKTGEERYLYLDVIHELVHIRQFMEGKELFDGRYSYVDRPTEIEAYGAAAKEAKRIGMSDDEVVEYLRVEWVTEEEFQRLLVSLNTSQKEEELIGSRSRRDKQRKRREGRRREPPKRTGPSSF